MQRGVRREVLVKLQEWWASVAGRPFDEIVAEGERFLPLLAEQFGELSSTAAALFYEAAREDSGVVGRFTARMAPSTAAETVSKEIGWAWAALRGSPDPLSALDPLSRLSSIIDAAALQDGRNTVMLNAKKDRAKPMWVRVPVGKTCAWCLMIASRGAAGVRGGRYWTAESAGLYDKFHSDCDCQPVPTWTADGSDFPGSYKPDALYDLYRTAREDAGSGNPKAIMRALRRLDGGVHVSDGVPN